MHFGHDDYLLWFRYPHRTDVAPRPNWRAVAPGERPGRRRPLRSAALLTWLRGRRRRRLRSPARGGRGRGELDIHAYLELEFALDEDQGPGSRGH